MIMDIRKQQQGFTLVEVLVAIVVLTIGLLATAYMQARSIDGYAQAIRTTKAATWAEDRIETLMALSYSNANLQDTNTIGVAAGGTGLDCIDATPCAVSRAPGGVTAYGAKCDNPVPCTADYGPVAQSNKDGAYTVFWNVANNYPIFGCKTIRVLVRRSNSEAWRLPITLDYLKMEPI